MNNETLEQIGRRHFTDYMGSVFTDKSEEMQANMIFAFVQGYLAGELHQINKRMEELCNS
jgi:hypothetical protein